MVARTRAATRDYFTAAARYCSSLTFSSQVVVPKLIATWVNGASGRAPCQ